MCLYSTFLRDLNFKHILLQHVKKKSYTYFLLICSYPTSNLENNPPAPLFLLVVAACKNDMDGELYMICIPFQAS